MRSKSQVLRGEDLRKLLAKETAFALTGQDDAASATPFVTLTTEDNVARLGYPLDVGKPGGWFVTPMGSAKLTTDDDAAIVTGPKATGADFRLGLRATLFWGGTLTTGTQAAQSGPLYRARMTRLATFDQRIELERAEIKRIYASDATWQKRLLDSLDERAEKWFWAAEVERYLKDAKQRRLSQHYFFAAAESALGEEERVFKESLDAPTSMKDGAVSFEGELGYGYLARTAKTRWHFTAAFGLQHVTNLSTGLLEKQTVDSVSVLANGFTTATAQEVYVGPLRNRLEPYAEGSALIYFANNKLSKGDVANFGVKVALRHVLAETGEFRPKGSLLRFQLGPVVSLRGKDDKPSVVVFPHIDYRDDRFAARLSLGVPF